MPHVHQRDWSGNVSLPQGNKCSERFDDCAAQPTCDVAGLDDEGVEVQDEELLVEPQLVPTSSNEEPNLSGNGLDDLKRWPADMPVRRQSPGEGASDEPLHARERTTQPACPPLRPTEGWSHRFAGNPSKDADNRSASQRAPTTQQGDSFADSFRQGANILGQYRITRVRERGSFVLADALHLDMGCRVQVQILSPRARRFRFLREHLSATAQALAQMQSRHSCRLLDTGTFDSGAPFTVVQVTTGVSLAQRIRAQGPLPLTDAVELVLQIGESLAEAHAHGIVHGALAPSNVRLAHGIDGVEVAVVSGFGILPNSAVDLVQNRLTPLLGRKRSREAVGYFPPEQVRRPQAIDPASDIWSLGAILHELLTGEPAFRGEGVAAVLACVVADTPSPVTALRSDIPRELEFILLRCLSKDAASRFPSIADLARALLPFASADSQEAVERISRIVARGHPQVGSDYRTNALVRVRQPTRAETNGSVASPPAERARTFGRGQLGSLPWNAIAVGLLAGIGGALAATYLIMHLMPAGKQEPGLVASTHNQSRIHAATPVTLSPTVPPQRSNEGTPPVAPIATGSSFAISSAAPPSAEQTAPRAVAPKARRVSATEANLTAVLPPSAKGEQPLRPLPTRTATAAALFDDIK